MRLLPICGCLWALCGLLALAVRPASGDDMALTAPLDVSDLSAPSFRVFGREDGLSDEIWSTVGLASDGFVWAGSASQLARFDGYRWQAWPMPEASSLVRDMESAPDGSLWVLFEREGLARLQGEGWQLQPEIGGGVHRFSRLRGEGWHELWLVHQQRGFLRWSPQGWQAPFAHLQMPAGLPIAIERTQGLLGRPLQWIGSSDSGLWFRDADSAAAPWQRFEHPVIGAMFLTDLLRSEDQGREELWVLSYNGGVARITDEGVRVWRSGSGELPTEAIYAAQATHAEDGSRSLWIASRAGLLQVRGDHITTWDRRHGLPSNAVRGIKHLRSVDGIDLLWLATEGGMVRLALTQRPWLTVSLLGADNNGIFGVLVEPDGAGGERLWTGSAKQGLALLQDGEWRHFRQQDGTLPDEGVRGVWRVTDARGQPWRLLGLQPSGRLFEVQDDATLRELPVPWSGGLERLVTDVLTRGSGMDHELWTAHLRAGLYRFSQGSWQQFVAEGARLPWTVAGLAQQTTADGRQWLWAASDQGLARHDGSRWQLLAGAAGLLPEDGLRSVIVRKEDAGSVLWLGSNRSGVLRLDVSDPAQPRRIDDDGLPAPPDPTVYSVLDDGRGRLYVCTNNGVQVLSGSASAGWRSQVYRRRDGLVHDECNSGSQFVDAHGRYWVGTLGGLSMYDPAVDPEQAQTRPKPLRFTSLRVDGQELPLPAAQPLTLAAGSRELRLQYALLSGLREDESRYRSQLVGYDPEPSAWQQERQRSYTGLPPGEYRFEVEGRDHAGTVSPRLQLDLTVTPRWWQRADLQLLLLTGVLLLLAGAVMLYNRNLRMRQRLLRRQVAARTAELDQANARLTELSYTDPLTGVANRRRLTEALEPALARARERAQPLGLIIVDVDHFKAFNDRHGHLAGDAALRAVAQALQAATRDRDLVARFGGEEFACLLVDTDLGVVLQVAERMRALVEALPPRVLGNDEQTITLSAGVCCRVPAAAETAADLLQCADRALYRAKHEGRNRVVGAT